MTGLSVAHTARTLILLVLLNLRCCDSFRNLGGPHVVNGQLVPLCIAIVGVPAVLLGWTIAAHNVRVWRVRKLARSLPVGTREQILGRIAESARGSSVCTLLVPVNSPRDESQSASASRPDMTASRFGGSPYGEPGEQWPNRDDASTQPADFLIQVRLDDPLPSPWAGRLIVVFLKLDVTQTVLVYAAPSPAKYARRPGSSDASPECLLMPLQIPKTKPTSIPRPTRPTIQHRCSRSRLPAPL